VNQKEGVNNLCKEHKNPYKFSGRNEKQRLLFSLVHLKLLIVRLFLLFLRGSLYADMDRILTSEANVREDSQKAIILHNLHEEVLILGTEPSTLAMWGVLKEMITNLSKRVRHTA
jgi:hypothetical protein